MPYDVGNPPEKLRGLPQNKQRQWVHVYDSCMKKHGDDIKCQKMSWGVTHGWRTDKGFDPNDPDRDHEIEDQVAFDEFIEKTVKQATEEVVSETLGTSVEVVE